MKKSTLAILVILSGPAFAHAASLKPGLWEMKQVRQVMDGRDMSATIAAAQAKMQQALAAVPAEQRKQMEAMMSRQGVSPQGGAAGTTRICVSAAMAAKDAPMVDPTGHCEPAKLSKSGNKTNFEFSCASNGRTSVGKGETTVTGDVVATRVDMTVTDARGSHTMQSETEMKYLGADCQGIKPADQLAREAPGNPSGKAQ